MPTKLNVAKEARKLHRETQEARKQAGLEDGKKHVVTFVSKVESALKKTIADNARLEMTRNSLDHGSGSKKFYDEAIKEGKAAEAALQKEYEQIQKRRIK